MNLFNPRSIINGSLVRNFLHQNISITVHINSIDNSGTTLKAKTTDHHNINIIASKPVNPKVLNHWVEVIGIPTSPDTIKAKEIIRLPSSNAPDDDFDTHAHNMAVQFLNNGKDPFKTS